MPTTVLLIINIMFYYSGKHELKCIESKHMKYLMLFFGLIFLVSCTNDKYEEISVSIETLKKQNESEKIALEGEIKKLNEQISALRSEKVQLEQGLNNYVKYLQSSNDQQEKKYQKINNEINNLSKRIGQIKPLPENDSKIEETDDPTRPVAIVSEGESIVVNPANSGGTRYILAEIYLLRGKADDKGFQKKVEEKSKLLQAVTTDQLSAEDAKSLATPATKQRIKAQLKLAYQKLLGEDHPIKDVIISKWILQ